MALFLGYFLFKTIVEIGQLGYVLFFFIYGIVAGMTIFYRIIRRENILKAHPTHLYQYLANGWGYPHIVISVIYAAMQLAVHGIVVYLDQESEMSISLS